jgi:hypothetical protein
MTMPLPIETFRAEISQELNRHATGYLDRQIAWRRELIARYQAEIDELISLKPPQARLRPVPTPATVAGKIGRTKRKTG